MREGLPLDGKCEKCGRLDNLYLRGSPVKHIILCEDCLSEQDRRVGERDRRKG